MPDHIGPSTLLPDAGASRPIRRSRLMLMSLSFALLSALALFLSEPQIGLTWDEPAYINAAKEYVAWFQRLASAGGEALRPEVIDRHWQWNHEHPPLDKIWSGLVWAAARSWLDDLPAHRLGNILLTAFGIGGLFYSVARGFGVWAGLAAGVALLSLPRFFFHAHLAALDVPAAVAVFLVTALFWHTHRRTGFGWDLLLGIAWGAALATKINALFVLPTLVLWMLIFERRALVLRRLVIAGALGPLVFIVLWPWLYHETLERLIAYIRFITVDHWQIGQWYLGEWHMPPPWHFPFVMLVAVTPLAILLLAAVGAARAVGLWRAGDEAARTRAGQAGLWMLSAAPPLLALAAGRTMVYDNERLFMPVFFFIAALAGIGLITLGGALRAFVSRRGRPGAGIPAVASLTAALFAPHLITGATLYPHLLSYYSETIGGLRGAARLELETTYWCETYAAALPYINANAPPDAVIWAEDWSHDVLLYYQYSGRLRPDLKVALAQGAGSLFSRYGLDGVPADIADADYVIVAYRQTGFAVHPKIERWMRGRTPLVRLERAGLPLMELYARQ